MSPSEIPPSTEARRIRPAQRADVPAMLAIYNHAIRHTTATYDYEPRTLEQRLEWFDEHERDDYPMFVAVDGQDRVVGWSSLSRYHAKPGYRFTVENSVYVEEEHRGQGWGRRLLVPLIDAAKARGYHAILAVIDGDNRTSIRLHERFGFEEVGRFKEVGYKFDRWLDVVYMERRV